MMLIETMHRKPMHHRFQLHLNNIKAVVGYVRTSNPAEDMLKTVLLFPPKCGDSPFQAVNLNDDNIKKTYKLHKMKLTLRTFPSDFP